MNRLAELPVRLFEIQLLALTLEIIAHLEHKQSQLQIQQIKASGEVAPPNCCVLRYQARSPSGTYWYYKLHAQSPIFPTREPDKFSKYKHLGKAGSPAHIDAVMQVARRTQIQYLQSCIDSLRESWADLYQGLLEKQKK